MFGSDMMNLPDLNEARKRTDKEVLYLENGITKKVNISEIGDFIKPEYQIPFFDLHFQKLKSDDNSVLY